MGRQPNTDGLGLDDVGVDVTPDGAVAVNDFLQTTNPAIYAVGDVTPIPEYVYVAAAAGTLAARNALSELVADSGTGRLLGAHVVTAEAGENIQAATLAVKHGLTVDDLTNTLFPYLTYAEALRLAAVSFDKDLSKLSCCV